MQEWVTTRYLISSSRRRRSHSCVVDRVLFSSYFLVLLLIHFYCVSGLRISNKLLYHRHWWSRSPRHGQQVSVMATSEPANSAGSAIDVNGFFEDSLLEVREPLLLHVEGTIPHYVSGALIRNGPAVFGSIADSKLRRYNHIFDGLAKLTRYEIKEGKVHFLAKFLRSNMYKAIVDERADLPPTITTGPVIPEFGFFQKLYALFAGLSKFDNVPVNVHQIAGEEGPWVAVTDAPVMLEFDPETLETKGRVAYNNSIFPTGSMELFSTAHPHRRTTAAGTEFTYNYFLEYKASSFGKTAAHIVSTDTSLNRCIVGTVPFEDGLIPYVHDFSLTSRFAVLCVWPLAIDMAKMVNGKGFLPQLEWLADKGVPTRIYVFDLQQFDDNVTASRQPIAAFEADPLFAYHHINAFENGGEVVVDVTGYAHPGIINGEHGFAYLTNVLDPEKRKLQERDGTCYRFRLPLPSQILDKCAPPEWIVPTKLQGYNTNGRPCTSELVRINPAFKGKSYRYSYGFTGFAADEGFKEWALVKQDHVLSEQAATTKADDVPAITSCWEWKSPDCFPSEPIFVADPNGRNEDDGVLLSQVYDARRSETFMVVVNASDMTELARCYTGLRCPVSFHGQFSQK